MEPREWQLIGKLLELTRDWTRFDVIEPHQKKIAKEIGTELNQLGGYDLMLYAYRTVRAANRFSTDLQHIWDGIGEWKW